MTILSDMVLSPGHISCKKCLNWNPLHRHYSVRVRCNNGSLFTSASTQSSIQRGIRGNIVAVILNRSIKMSY